MKISYFDSVINFKINIVLAEVVYFVERENIHDSVADKCWNLLKTLLCRCVNRVNSLLTGAPPPPLSVTASTSADWPWRHRGAITLSDGKVWWRHAEQAPAWHTSRDDVAKNVSSDCGKNIISEFSGDGDVVFMEPGTRRTFSSIHEKKPVPVSVPLSPPVGCSLKGLLG